MAINTNTSNQIALQLVSVGVAVGGGAWAGSGFGPIGAAGGALFGGASVLVGATTDWVCTKIFNLNDEAANQAARVVSAVLTFFASVASGMLALSLAGFSITVGSAIALTLVSGITSLVLSCALYCCCGVGEQNQP